MRNTGNFSDILNGHRHKPYSFSFEAKHK